MEKTDVVLVILSRGLLDNVIKNLKLDNINLGAIFADLAPDDKFFKIDDKEVPLVSYSTMNKRVNEFKKFFWLIGGSAKGASEVGKMRNFLTTIGVPGNKIINFEVAEQISSTWLANLKYISEHGADFFVTGNEYTQVGLNLKYIPRVHADKNVARGGVILADVGQDLQQSYLTAKNVFEHVKPGSIKFVLIGLAPNALRYDNAKDFPFCTKNLQYLFALNSDVENDNDLVLKDLLVDDVKNNFLATTSARADLNFDAIKDAQNPGLSAQAIIEWDGNIKYPSTDAVEKNIQILKDYIELCLANGAKPVAIIFPFAPNVRKIYDKKILGSLREELRKLEKSHDFFCVDWYDHLSYDSFYDMTHLNSKGAMFVNSLISLKLYRKKLLPTETFCEMPYTYFNHLSWTVAKGEYNDLMKNVFNTAAKMIRHKDKVKIGFVTYDASIWCGDELYKIFARDKRFETTIFLCLRKDKPDEELIQKDFWHGVEQFKSRGLNVVAIDKPDFDFPPQDILIFMTPYLGVLPEVVGTEKITAKTLEIYLPYAISIANFNLYNYEIFHVCWKAFFAATVDLKTYEKKCNIGAPYAILSGYPKMDIFFKHDSQFRFGWKMMRPKAKRIIWAPHWTISGGVNIATFQYNYKFMYEFAKSHPETSWVVKPHPNLFFSAVKENIFPSVEAFKEYLQQWEDLPNAKVHTGAYYQDIFATSDGMIHDCSSFIAEYQYVNKPMIYLNLDMQKFNELGNEILKASYLVDGQDLEAVAATMQEVFIEGNDFKAAERKKVFQKYLYYTEYTGMLASDFIYKNISDELRKE